MPYSALLLIIAVLGYVQVLPNEILAVVLMFVTTIRFIAALDYRPAILEVASITAVIQMVFAATVMYAFFNGHYKYRMYVPAAEYFAYAIPATCMFLIALAIPLRIGKQIPAIAKPKMTDNRLGMQLVVIGVLSGVASRWAPGQLGFLFYLLSQLRYVGALYLYFNKYRYRWHVMAVVFGLLLLTAKKTGMFHELLLWSTLISTYYFIMRPRPLRQKIAFLTIAFLAVSFIQLIKAEYRKELREQGSVSMTGMMANRMMEQGQEAFGQSWQESMVVRMNQGWIVSRVMAVVPASVPYAHGDTIVAALRAALLPRVLDPSKSRASGRDNVRKYAALAIRDDTTMALGPVGEAFANFGDLGGIATMFVFGLSLNAIYCVLAAYSYQNQYFLFVMPLMFLQAIKMETEFLTVFNHLSKAGIVIAVVYMFLIRRQMIIRTELEKEETPAVRMSGLS